MIKMLTNLARPAGVEPTTFGFGNQHSIQLSYGRVIDDTKVRILPQNVRYGFDPNIPLEKWVLYLHHPTIVSIC